MYTLPVPFPPPGPPASQYEQDFNVAYIKSRKKALADFFIGEPGSADPDGDSLSEAQRLNLADKLYEEKIDFDEEIDCNGSNAYETMYERVEIYGYERVPVGTGNTPQPPEVVDKANLIGPAIPGQYIKCSLDINDYLPGGSLYYGGQ